MNLIYESTRKINYLTLNELNSKFDGLLCFTIQTDMIHIKAYLA